MSKARDLANQVSNLITISTGGSNFVTPQVLSASIANIDLTPYATKAQLSASVASIDVTDELNATVFVGSASPSSSTKIWVDTTTASAPLIKTYSNNLWRGARLFNLDGFFTASGGTSTYMDGNYRVHIFNGSSNLLVSEASQNDQYKFNGQIEYLIIGGGGGGGQHWAAGGGAGGYLTGFQNLTANNYVIQVGAGGAGGTSDSVGTVAHGKSGENSSFNSMIAIGGGGGGMDGNGDGNGAGFSNGYQGGSGGGGADDPPNYGGSGTPGQGNAGGASNGSNTGGGGGGAGTMGSTSSGSNGGNGGNGLSSSITGTSTIRAGGGGGSTNGGTAGNGGSGGGGAGGKYAVSNGSNGTTNTGSGGGGGPYQRNGGNGGSGIVIIRYLT